MTTDELKDLQERHAAACAKLADLSARMTPDYWATLSAEDKSAAALELAEAKVTVSGLHAEVTAQS